MFCPACAESLIAVFDGPSMSKRKKKRTGAGPLRASREAPSRRGGTRSRLVQGMIIAVIAGLAWLVFFRVGGFQPELPELDLESMEPQVRDAILDSRAKVVEQPSSGNLGILGELLQAHGLDAEASVCYRQAVELHDDFRWRYLNAHALRAVEPVTALEQAKRAVELNSDYSPAYVVSGQLLEQEGRVDEAHEAYRGAVSADPQSAIAVFGYGRTLLSLGQLAPALEQLERAAELAPNAGEIRAALAQVHRQLGDRDQARHQARLASELDEAIGIADPVHFRMRQRSRSSITMLQRAIQARDEGQFDEAESLLRELVALRPEDANIRAELGDTLAMTDRFDEAREAFDKALELNPNTPGALYGMGNALNLDGDYTGAEEHYRRALAQRSDHVPTLLNLGGLLSYQGRADEAESVFRDALELEPSGFGPNRQLGQLLLRQRRVDDAIVHLEKALDAEPDAGAVHLQLSLAYAASGRMDLARQHALRAQEAGQSLPAPLHKIIGNGPA